MNSQGSQSSDEEFVARVRSMIEEEPSQRIISKNEKLPALPQVMQTKEERMLAFKFTTAKELRPIGRIESLTKEHIIIQSILLEFVIELDQLIILESQEILGVVDDVLGKVEKPHYSILLDPYTKQLYEQGAFKLGDVAYIDMSHTSVIDAQKIKELQQRKGCDASNQFDEEVLAEHDVDYSDDESEAMHKHHKKNKKKNLEEGEIQNKPKQKAQYISQPPYQQQPINQQPHHQQYIQQPQLQMQQQPFTQQQQQFNPQFPIFQPPMNMTPQQFQQYQQIQFQQYQQQFFQQQAAQQQYQAQIMDQLNPNHKQ